MNEHQVVAAVPGPGAPREVLDLIHRGVRLRFELDSEGFADRLLELARAACPDAVRSAQEHIVRLSLDDLYLATACVRGERRAWDELAATHFDFMRTFARRFLPAPASADLADEVIAEVWARDKLRQYEGRSTLRTWLGTVIAHAALNSRKRASRFAQLDADPLRVAHEMAAVPDGHGHEEGYDAALFRELLVAAVKELPPESKLLLQLYYEQGLNLEEIGVTLRVSSAAISRRLKSTREELRAALEMRSRRRAGSSAQELRAGLDLARIDFDLSALLRADPVATAERDDVV